MRTAGSGQHGWIAASRAGLVQADELYAGAAVALLVVLIALVIANMGRAKVSWVVGSDSVSLVWLVIFSAIIGLLLGMALGVMFHWRTRTPRG